eukprot:4817475-Prorocentrum_lima.AAC.1
MVLLTCMKARVKWLRDTDTQTKPAILVLCYLNRVLVPFRACCKAVFLPEDVPVMTVDASRDRTAPM